MIQISVEEACDNVINEISVVVLFERLVVQISAVVSCGRPMIQILVVVSCGRLMIQISVAVSCDRMMILGYKRDLQESDLWDLNPRDKSDTVVPTFERLWKAEVERCMSKG